MNTVLVTGATGFTGANVVRAFAAAGDRVVAVDRIPPDAGVLAFWNGFAEPVTFVECDVTRRDWSTSLPIQRADMVVHGAAVTNQRADQEVPRAADAVEVNLVGTINVFEWSAAAQVRRFAFLSSGASYGQPLDLQDLLVEDTANEPVNVYAVTKYAGELIVDRLAELGGVSAISIRLPSQYGPLERLTPDRLRISQMHAWCNAAVRGEELTVVRPQLPRDFTYAPDGAEGVRALCIAPTLNHKVYNVSTEIGLTTEDIIGTLAELVPGLRCKYVEGGTVSRSDRPPMSSKRLREDTGWTPKFDLRAGVADYLTWLKDAIAHGVRTM